MLRTTPEANDLLRRGSIALAEMEKNGVRIDVAKLDRTIEEVKEGERRIESELKEDDVYRTWRNVYGKKTDLESSQQLSRILFDELGCKSHGKTETGQHSTSEKDLLKIDLPFVAQYLELRRTKKLLNAFLLNIKQQLVGDVVRPFFHLTDVRSYRSASSDPNLQNFPSRNPVLAKKVRECFIPRNGHVLLEADFKAIEVGTAASVTGDPVLIDEVCNPLADMHRDTATQLFMIEQSQVQKKSSRHWAKNLFVFPQFYGSVYFQCAPSIWETMEHSAELIDGRTFLQHLASKGITELGACGPDEQPDGGTFARHVKSVQDDFWHRRFRVYAACKKRWWKEYQATGRMRTVTGFVIRGVYRRNQISSLHVQGPAFHCNLFTIIAIDAWLRKNKMRTLAVGQIHDCVLFDAYDPEWQDVAAELKRIVKEDLPAAWDWIKVPMTLEFELARENWYAKKEVKL